VNVAIVLAPDFSGRLQKLAFHTPVWLVETPENRAAAEQEWMRTVEWPHIDVTLFRSEHDWRTLFAQVALHHDVDHVEIIGSPLTDAAREALTGAGFQRVDETAEGFRARKS
jgi:hypothetical protein